MRQRPLPRSWTHSQRLAVSVTVAGHSVSTGFQTESLPWLSLPINRSQRSCAKTKRGWVSHPTQPLSLIQPIVPNAPSDTLSKGRHRLRKKHYSMELASQLSPASFVPIAPQAP